VDLTKNVRNLDTTEAVPKSIPNSPLTVSWVCPFVNVKCFERDDASAFYVLLAELYVLVFLDT